MGILQIKLKNCIQTILDLEPVMRKNGEFSFMNDFLHLRTFLAHIEEMELAETDVARLEHITSSFLEELSRSSYIFEPYKKIIQ